MKTTILHFECCNWSVIATAMRDGVIKIRKNKALLSLEQNSAFQNCRSGELQAHERPEFMSRLYKRFLTFHSFSRIWYTWHERLVHLVDNVDSAIYLLKCRMSKCAVHYYPIFNVTKSNISLFSRESTNERAWILPNRKRRVHSSKRGFFPRLFVNQRLPFLTVCGAELHYFTSAPCCREPETTQLSIT